MQQLALAISVLSVFVSAFSAQAQVPDGSTLVDVELIPSATAFTPGTPLTVGVLLKIKPQWHIYWQNPGDSGAPPSIAIRNAPPGFTISPPRFPVPVRHVSPGDIVNYIYSNEVMLFVTISPPRDFLNPPLAAPVVMQVDVDWLVCDEDRCLPGSATSSLTLPVATPENPAMTANSDRFDPFLRKVPQGPMNLDELIRRTTATVTWTPKPLNGDNSDNNADDHLGWEFELVRPRETATSDAPSPFIDFFPLSDENKDHAIFVAMQICGPMRIDFRRPAGSRAAARLRGVVVMRPKPDGPIEYYEVDSLEPGQ